MAPSLQPLLDSLSTPEFDEFGFLTLTAINWAANDITLSLTVHYQDRADQSWRLLCRDARSSRILNNRDIVTVDIETEHPVLLPHTEATAELYFSSRPTNSDAAVVNLIEAHRAVVGDWFECFHFFNLGPGHSLRASLDGGFGKLAEGPKSLIERYTEVLRRAGVSVSSPPPRPQAWWNGDRWIQEVEPLVAVILGGSYVVSPNVTAEKA